MADELHVKGKDLKDLKVVELKKELAERGLTVTGNKSELVSRLEDYLLKQGDNLEEIEVDLVLESDIEQIGSRDFEQETSEDTYDEQEASSEQESKAEQSDEKVEVQSENIPPVTAEPVGSHQDLNNETVKQIKKVPLNSQKTDSEKRADRQQRFGIALNDKQKKEARAQRFGTADKNSGNQQLSGGTTKNGVDLDKLSKRAERFGAVSPHVAKKVEEERIKKRKERFGVTMSGLPTDGEARKKMRAERFKQT